MAGRNTVHIREYAPADRAAIMALAPRLMEGIPPWRDAAAWLTAVQGWLASAADTAGLPGQAVFVAVDGDQVVGMVHAAERAHFTGQVDAYVGELASAAGQERRGIGSALMQAAEEWGAQRGLEYLTLETGTANHTARAFYAALGYLEEDVRLTKKIRAGTR
jgi:ribosomal protein S18 acetylase RimI-like enzyme